MLELVHFALILMNRLSKTESAVFLYCRFSLLFLKESVLPDDLDLITILIFFTNHPKSICKQQPMPDVLGFCMGQNKEHFDMEASNRKGKCVPR